MTKEETVKWLESLKHDIGEARYIDLWHYEQSIDMAIEALQAQEVTEKVTEELADKINEAYAKGYNAAKAEIALSGEYERAYQRGLKDAQKWIPVSERLPEENVVVLTQAKFKDDIKMAVSARQDYNYWMGWGTREVNIVAWMPLPEPYKAESEGV